MKCKLLKKDLTTHGGFKWEVGKTYTIEKFGIELCSDQVFHGYHSPETAALFNVIHANISDPVCYEIEYGDIVADDGLKFGSKTMRLVKQIELPKITIRQRVIFSVLCAFEVSFLLSKRIDKWDDWAESFLSNDTADVAADVAADAAADAAYSAYSVDAATYAARAARAAASAAYAVDAATYAAAYAYVVDAVVAARANTNLNFTQLAKKALRWDN